MKIRIMIVSAMLLLSSVVSLNAAVKDDAKAVSKKECPLKGTPACPLIRHHAVTTKTVHAKAVTKKECPLQGTPDCPLAHRSCCKK